MQLVFQKPDRGAALIYLFLLGGGAWHSLSVLQTTMQVLAGPMMIALPLWLLVRFDRSLRERGSRVPWNLYSWAGFTLVMGLTIELVGVRTGVPFGHYWYGDILQPQIAGVPLAIGLSWIGISLSSAALAQRLCSPDGVLGYVLFPAITGALMVAFDLVMEPAAIQLGYWHWLGESVPLQNYATWFVCGFIIAAAGLKFSILRRRIPAAGVHLYFAQVIYFLLATL